jgi:hypothetical protein
MKLYDLLTDAELQKVKFLTEIRNVYFKDLTVDELTELVNILDESDKKYHFRLHTAIKSLTELHYRQTEKLTL